jgi:hydroxymethylpyrimidine/phosphomethylpyrimidine kinase
MFSAMITANLARGRGAMEAITLAKEHVTRALTAAAAHARDVAQTTAWTPRLATTSPAAEERSPAHAA